MHLCWQQQQKASQKPEEQPAYISLATSASQRARTRALTLTATFTYIHPSIHSYRTALIVRLSLLACASYAVQSIVLSGVHRSVRKLVRSVLRSIGRLHAPTFTNRRDWHAPSILVLPHHTPHSPPHLHLPESFGPPAVGLSFSAH